MAQSYRPRRATSSSLASDTLPRIQSSRWDRYGSDVEYHNQLASSSILIFPNPPSAEESPSFESRFEFTGSTPSLPTDVTLDSLRSRSRSRSGENENEYGESWHDVSGTFRRDWERMVPEEEWDIDSEDLRRGWGNARFTNPLRSAHTRTSSNVTSPSSNALSIAPQLPFRLPFLSCLRTLFDPDESTLHLLSRSPDQHTGTSALFPFSPGSCSSYESEEEEELPHGAHKLLLHNPDKPKNGMLLKAGMDSSEVPADLTSPTRIPVWRFLEFVIEGGVKVWREVQIWQAVGDTRLVGV